MAPKSDGRNSISSSGMPQPRRNAAGILPLERTSVSTPTMLA
jgi:hypothetical protein